MSSSTRKKNAASLATRIIPQLFFLKAKHIAFYLPNDGEIDPVPLLELAFQRKKKCYLPCLMNGADRIYGNLLRFQQFDPFESQLGLNRFGIPEPEYNPSLRISSCMLDLVFVPLVAFDGEGNRMGMGKGYYDRTFSKARLRWRRPLMVGLAHSVQQADSLPQQPWDVPMDMVVTENEWFEIKTTGRRK